MTITSEQYQHLEQNLNLSYKNSQLLLELLQEEQQALTIRNFEYIEKNLDEKTSLIDTLQQLATQRSAIASTMQLESEAQLAKLCELEDAALWKHWQNNAAIWEQCQQQNTINAEIANRSQHVTTQLLNIMSGSGSSETYNQNGNKKKDGNSRSLANA